MVFRLVEQQIQQKQEKKAFENKIKYEEGQINQKKAIEAYSLDRKEKDESRAKRLNYQRKIDE